MLLTMLRDGRLHLSAVARLASHRTPANREALLKRAAHRSKREIEELIAGLKARPDVRPMIRKLPTRTSGAPRGDDARGPLEMAGAQSGAGQPAGTPRSELVPERVELLALNADGDELPVDLAGNGLPLARVAPASPAPDRPARIEALSPSRHKVQFTASDELRGKLERLQALMRGTVPDGGLATIIGLAVTEKLERLEAKRFGKSKAPRKSLARTDTRPTSRHVPAAVRRAVYRRDEGRCTFVDERGRRCGARDRLEFHHHHQPFGRGGDHSTKNVRLKCRAHNQLLAQRDFGKGKMGRYRSRRRSEGRVSEPAAVYGGSGVSGPGGVTGLPLPP